MFWEAFAGFSRIDELLSGPDLTIKELLDDDDLLQKCREKDQRLIDFLSRPDNLDYLLDLVSHTPVSNVFDHNLYRYPSLACEILTNDIDEILDGIIESQSIIDKPVENSFYHDHHHHHLNHNNNTDGDDTGNNIMESTGISSSSPSPSSSVVFHESDKSATNMSVISNHDDDSVNNSAMELCNLTPTDNNNYNDTTNNSSNNEVNNLSTSMSIIDESSLNNSSSSYSSSTANTIVNNMEDKSINNTLDHHVNTLNSSTDILSSSTVFNNGEMKTSPPPSTTKTMDIAATTSRIRRPRLDKLIQFFSSNQSVNPLSASFVSRVLIHLTLYRGSVVIPYLRSSQDFLNKVFSCLESCAVADLIIQLAQQETKQQCLVFEWFKTDRVVERLVEKFDPIYSFEMHESAAHCLIELITVLRNYLINNPLNTTDGVNFSLGPNNATNGGDGGSSDDLSAADSTTPKTTNNPNYLNTTQSTSSISGFPVNNSSISHLLDDYIDDDDATYKAAENLLNILESEKTMSMLLNRILSNEEQIVTSSIVVNCVNVFMAVMDKRKPESGFPVGGGAGESTETGSLIGYGIPGPKNDISCTNNKTINNTSNDSALLMTNGDDAVGGGGNKSSNDCDTSSINNRQQQQQQQQSVHDMNSLPIDKQHISKACENLSKACLSCLSELHKLLKTFHPQFYNTVSTTNGILNPPLGRCRLAVVQLIAALTSLPMNLQLIKAIVANGFVKTLMELFEQYPSNTFLHHSVVDVLTSLFKHSGITNTMKTPTTTTTSTSGGNGNANDTFNPNFSTSKKTNQIDDNQSPSSTTPDLSSSSSSVDSGVTITAADSSTDTAKVTAATVVMNTTHFDEFNSILINLIKDHHLIDWCLRLSPLPGKNDRPDVPYSPNSSLVRLSKAKPKPGYAGHIWQIANLIDSAMNNSNNGSRGEFVKSIFEDLDSKVKDAWSEFVKEDLSVINSMQVVEDLSESTTISQEGGLLRLITQYNLNKLLSNSSDLLSLAAGGLNLSKTPFVLAPISSLNLMQHKLSDLNGAIRGGSNSSSRANSTEGLTLQVSTGVENNGDNDADDDDIIDEGDDQQQKHRQLDNQSPFTLLPIQPSSDILISGRNNVSGRVGGGGGISSCSLSDLWLDPDDMEVDDGDDREQHGKSDQQTPSTLHRFTSKSFRQINLCVKNDDNVDDDDEVAMGNDDETTSKVNHHRSLRHRSSSNSSGSNPMSDDDDDGDDEGCEEAKTHNVEDEGEGEGVDDVDDEDDDDDEEEDLKSPIQIKQQHSSKLTNSYAPAGGLLFKSNPLLKGNEEFCEFDILRKPIEELKISESIKQIYNTKIDNPWSNEANQSTGTNDEWADFKKASTLSSMTTSHQLDSNESSFKWADFDNISSDNKNNNDNNNNSEVVYPGTLNGITGSESTTGSTNTVNTTTTTTPIVTPSKDTTTNIVSSDNSISTTKCNTSSFPVEKQLQSKSNETSYLPVSTSSSCPATSATPTTQSSVLPSLLNANIFQK